MTSSADPRGGPTSTRWIELSVEADVEAVEAVSEILGRVAAGTAVQPTRLIRDPDDELSAREDPEFARRVRYDEPGSMLGRFFLTHAFGGAEVVIAIEIRGLRDEGAV